MMHITPKRCIGLFFIIYTLFSCSGKRKTCSTTALSYRSIIQSMKNHENYWTRWDMPFRNVVEILRLFWYHIAKCQIILRLWFLLHVKFQTGPRIKRRNTYTSIHFPWRKRDLQPKNKSIQRNFSGNKQKMKFTAIMLY